MPSVVLKFEKEMKMAVFEQWEEAWNKNDAAAWIALLHEDYQCRWCNLYIYKQWLACQYFWCACKCVFSVILRVGQKHCVGHGNRKISVLTHCSTLQKTQDWTGTK